MQFLKSVKILLSACPSNWMFEDRKTIAFCSTFSQDNENFGKCFTKKLSDLQMININLMLRGT